MSFRITYSNWQSSHSHERKRKKRACLMVMLFGFGLAHFQWKIHYIIICKIQRRYLVFSGVREIRVHSSMFDVLCPFRPIHDFFITKLGMFSSQNTQYSPMMPKYSKWIETTRSCKSTHAKIHLRKYFIDIYKFTFFDLGHAKAKYCVLWQFWKLWWFFCMTVIAEKYGGMEPEAHSKYI